MKAYFSEKSIRALQIKTDAGRVETWGSKTKSNQQKVWNLDYAHELIGFRGVGGLNSISSLGVIILDKKSCGIEAFEGASVQKNLRMEDDPRFYVIMVGCILLILVFFAIIVFQWSIIWNAYA